MTLRDSEVLLALLNGETAKQQALREGITESGVRSARSNLYRKLGVSNAYQAVALVLRNPTVRSDC